jgi:hypothetical protein
MKSAILFLVFNRPDTTRQVFEAIRAARPPRLYVAADGPRADRPGEAERCDGVRRIATAVDWPCEVKTLFLDQNLGCKMGVSSGITWFFENEAEGIILEDDVLPVASFFDYCDELLERYRHDERVAMISGCNLISRRFEPKESYFFSRYNHIWGWASWRRAWEHYDVTMKRWPAWRDEGGLARIANGSWLFEAYWRVFFDDTYYGKVDTWDYQWTFTCWCLGALSVLPAENQTRNLGFGADATHTTEEAPEYVVESEPRLLVFPLIHPVSVERQVEADKLINERVFDMGWTMVIKNKLLEFPIIRKVIKIIRTISR